MTTRIWTRAAALALALLPALASAQLAAALDEVLNRAELGHDGVAGVAVLDINSGAMIYEHRADVPLAPASNMKLLTSAAAVKILGPGFAFNTSIRLSDNGSLVVVGSGDPALGDPEVLGKRTPAESLEGLLSAATDALEMRGTPADEIIIDDRVFDRELLHPDWPRDQLERWYCAPVQGVNVHSNVLAFYPSPGTADSGPSAGMDPVAPWVELANNARRVTEGRNAVWIQRTETDDRFILRGSIRVPSQSPIEVTLHEPGLFFGRLLADRAGAGTVRLASGNDVFEFSTPPLVSVSTAMDEIMRRVNYDSHNMYAECLLKRMGREITGEPGSWANGSAVLRMMVAEVLGPDHAASMVIRDGSGLSRENRVRASTFAAWLAAMYRDDEARTALLGSLPTASDKLAQRFKLADIDHSVYGKTGTINRVRCLSGYVVDHETGRAAAFSVLVNGLTTGEAIASSKNLHSQIVEAIDDHLIEFAVPESATPVLGG